MTMIRSIQSLQFSLMLLAGWINRRQLEAIEYLKAENRLLKERLGGRRLREAAAKLIAQQGIGRLELRIQWLSRNCRPAGHPCVSCSIKAIGTPVRLR